MKGNPKCIFTDDYQRSIKGQMHIIYGIMKIDNQSQLFTKYHDQVMILCPHLSWMVKLLTLINSF